MGGRGGPGDLGPGAGAGIHQVRGFQDVERLNVMIQALGLNERTLVPVEAEPAQVVDRSLRGAGPHSRDVEILDPEDRLRPRWLRAESQATRKVRA